VEEDFKTYMETMAAMNRDMEGSLARIRNILDTTKMEVMERKKAATYHRNMEVALPSHEDEEESVPHTPLIPSPPAKPRAPEQPVVSTAKPRQATESTLPTSTFTREALRHRELWDIEATMRQTELLSKAVGEPPRTPLLESGTQDGIGVNFGRNLEETTMSSTACSPMKFDDGEPSPYLQKGYHVAEERVKDTAPSAPSPNTEDVVTTAILGRTLSGSNASSKKDKDVKGYDTRRPSVASSASSTPRGVQPASVAKVQTATKSAAGSVRSLNTRVKK
jgi:hypothetical protein